MLTESCWSVIGIYRTTWLNRTLHFHVQSTDVKEAGRVTVLRVFRSAIRRGPAPLMKIDAEGIWPNRAKWAAAQTFFPPFSFCVCVRGGLSYCQCQLDFMPSFLSIWADSSLYETIILPPTLCVFSAIGGKGRIPFYSCHPFLLEKVRES